MTVKEIKKQIKSHFSILDQVNEKDSKSLNSLLNGIIFSFSGGIENLDSNTNYIELINNIDNEVFDLILIENFYEITFDIKSKNYCFNICFDCKNNLVKFYFGSDIKLKDIEISTWSSMFNFWCSQAWIRDQKY